MKSFRLALPQSRIGKVFTALVVVWFAAVLLWFLAETICAIFPSATKLLGPLLSDF